jgi:Flp pilus assembly protein TadG
MNLKRFWRSKDGAAAIETAIVLPIFLTLTIGMVDVGAGMFQSMQMNAAAQAGAASLFINPSGANVQAAMTAAAGYTLNTSLTTGSISGGVVTATATCDTASGSPCAPIMPWTKIGSFFKTSVFPTHLASTATFRIE